MARRPLAPPQEPRGSKDPRVQFVEIPGARRLHVFNGREQVIQSSHVAWSIVWFKPDRGMSDVELAVCLDLLASWNPLRVLVLPRDAEDVDLPADAGTPAPLSDVSEVRPVVAELIAELPEELRDDVAAFVEQELSEANL